MKHALRGLAALPRLVALVLPVATAPALADSYAWDLSTVDPAPKSGNSLSLRVEPAGIGHVAYWTIGLGVRYGVRDGESWTLETLPDAGEPPPAAPGAAASPAPPDETQLIQHTSVQLALAPDGAPWIAEIDHGRISHSDAGPLAVRHREAGAWVTEWLGMSGSGASLEVDGAGVVHAAWGAYYGEVQYARRTGPNAWTTEVAFSPGSVAAMKIGPGGAVHLAVRDFDGIVQHVVRAPGGGWTATPVAAPAIFGNIGPAGLALDSAGRPAIVTNERDPLYPRTHLRLHRFDGAAWTPEDVDVDQTQKAGGILAFDAAGNPIVAYRRIANDRFVVAAPGGTGWGWTVVDSIGNGNQGMGGEFDAIGRPWFATATQDVGVRLAIGQATVGVPAAPAVDGTWLGTPWPQPARGGATVSLVVQVGRPGTLTFEMVDARGAVLRRERQALEAGAGAVRLSTQGLAPGVYWIRARDTAGRVAGRRIVIAG